MLGGEAVSRGWPLAVREQEAHVSLRETQETKIVKRRTTNNVVFSDASNLFVFELNINKELTHFIKTSSNILKL